MDNIIRKLTSRKFLVALVGVVSGLAMAFGADGNEIIGAVTTVASIVAYITGESKVDAAAAGEAKKNG